MEALKVVDSIETKAMSIADQAQAVKVVDSATYLAAGTMWKNIKDMLKEVEETFNPIIEKAHASHKEALAKKAKYFNPLDTALKHIKSLMSRYDQEQEEKRRAEERRLAEAARKAEEERLLQEALEAEEAAKASGASQEQVAQEVEQVLATPVYVPPVVIPKSVPKLDGGPVYRTVWKHRVTDLRALVMAVASGHAPIEALKENDAFLGQQARSLKQALTIPGVRAYPEKC